MAEYERRATPFHKSLIEVKTIGGVETTFFMLNVMFTAVMTINLEKLIMLVGGVFTHAFLVWLTKKDPLILKIYNRFRVQADAYDPWPRARQRRHPRPPGFAPGALR